MLCRKGIGCTVDSDVGEIEISFMESKKEKFQWPKHEDIMWIKSKDVLSIVTVLIPTRRSGRMLKLQA